MAELMVLALVKASKLTLMNATIGQEFIPTMPEAETAVLRVQRDVEFPGRISWSSHPPGSGLVCP